MKKAQSHGTSSLGAGWVPWTSRVAPHLTLAVNEADREIRIIEGGAERRLSAEDTVTFALELADIERYYAAEPAIGDRDSSAILTKPVAVELASGGVPGATAALAPRADAVEEAHASWGLVRAVRKALKPREEVVGRAILTACLVAVFVAYIAFPLMANSDTRIAWLTWARQHGSPELRHALPEFEQLDDPLPGELQHETAGVRRRFEELLRDDVAVAITPTVEGAERCRGSIKVAAPIDGPDASAQRVRERIRRAISGSTLPRPAEITVGAVNECSFAESGERRLCVPVALTHGEFRVSASYCLVHTSGVSDAARQPR